MRFFAILAFAVAFAAASGCGDSNCTRDILNECTPAFQFDNEDDCYYINLAVGEIWVIEDMGACNQSAAFDKSAATLFASSSSFNITDNALTYQGAAGTPTCDDSPAPRRKTVPFTYLVTFAYADKASSSDPIVQEDTCVKSITLLTDYPTCGSVQLKSNSNRGSGRRNRASGRRNSASSNTNGDDRREGCATSPLFGLNVSATPCQTGQCCGANFCFRDQHYGDCVALGDGITNPKFRPGSSCADDTCTPTYPGSGSGKGNTDVSLGSSLNNAGDAVPAGGALVVEVLDANQGTTDIPAGAVADQAVVAFQVNRFNLAGVEESVFHGYLSDGTWIEVTVESDALNGADIAVFRYDEDSSAWINAAEDCATTKSNVQIEVVGTVYTVPICHTSQFVVTLASDGDDKDDKKGKAVKVTKKAKPSKVKTAGATAAKAPKTAAKKEAGKKKTAVAIGVGIAGAAVATAGVAFLAKRRSNKKSKAPASPATAEIAVVSV